MAVITIIAILFAILGEVIANAKADAKKAACVFNMRQMGLGVCQYMVDFDDRYPQTKVHSSERPWIDDADGSIERPDRGNMLDLLGRYSTGVGDCPSDGGVDSPFCDSDPNSFETNSYLINSYFVWGLTGSSVLASANTIYVAERRSTFTNSVPPNCDDTYHPWWNSSNPVAPRNDMDENVGAIATTRHEGGSNFAFADGHSHWFKWGETYAPDAGINMHTPYQ